MTESVRPTTSTVDDPGQKPLWILGVVQLTVGAVVVGALVLVGRAILARRD
ncbi:hypothetical protein ACFQLZ_18535 [Halospeciosus flavus]